MQDYAGSIGELRPGVLFIKSSLWWYIGVGMSQMIVVEKNCG